MFARAGISSRVLRHGESIGGFFGRPKKKKKPKQKFRCYVPFMWSTCIAICGGLTILCGGTAMCVTGYYAKNFTSIDVTNGSHTWSEVDPIPYAIMWNMTYIGPVLMGCGCFAIVVACVVVCETRDKMLRIIEEDEKQGKKTSTKPDFYDLVIKKLKKTPGRPHSMETKLTTVVEGNTPSPGRRKSIFNILMRRSSLKSVKSTKSDFAHIGGALRRIPMQIFAIDISQSQKTSLLPISLTLGVDIGRKKLSTISTNPDYSDLYLVPKYPSSSCLPDLLKLNDDKLASLFPDRFSWLEETGHKSPLNFKPVREHKRTTQSATPRYGDSRDADDSDLDSSLCSVTVHVQQAEGGGEAVDNSTNGAGDFEFIKFSPASLKTGNTNMRLTTLTNPNAWRNKCSQYSKSADASVSGDELFPSVDIDRNKKTEDSDGPKQKRTTRRSLLRQKPVVEDSDPYSLPRDFPGSVSNRKESIHSESDNSLTPDISTFDDYKRKTHKMDSGCTSPAICPSVLDSTNDTGRGPKDPLRPTDDLTQNFDMTDASRSPTMYVNIVPIETGPSVCEETNRLLEHEDAPDIKHSTTDTSQTSVPAKRTLAQLDKDNKTSVFIPYTPKTSNARANSSMERASPLARSLAAVDPSLFSKLRSPHVTHTTSFTRHKLSGSSHFHYESEEVPPVSQNLRKCKTMINFHTSS